MKDLLATLRKALADHPEVELAILFGSAARGALGPTSDIDVAVRLSGTPAPWDLGAISAALAKAGGRRADIVLLDQARSALLRREISRGILLVGDPEELIELRCRAFREWREVAPRFRRCTDAMLKGLHRDVPAEGRS